MRLCKWKTYLKQAIRLCLVVPTTFLLTNCEDKNKGELLLKGINVRSGDYYLVIDEEYGSADPTLFDDPEILHKYKNQIYLKKSKLKSFMFGEGGGGGIALWKRGENQQYPVRSNPRTYNWSIPKEMWQFGKTLGRKETYAKSDNFLGRILQLKGIEGVSVYFNHPFYGQAKNWGIEQLSAQQINQHQGSLHYIYDETFISIHAQNSPNPKQQQQEEQQFVVSVLFPLVITHTTEDYDPHLELKNIQQRLAQEMSKSGVNSYFAIGKTYNSSWAFYGLLRDQRKKIGLFLHDDYRDQERNTLKLKQYEDYIFGMRIICAKDCFEQIQNMQPLNWVQSPVPQTELIDTAQTYVEGFGLQFNSAKVIQEYRYQFRNLFDVLSEEDLPQHEQSITANWQLGQMEYSAISAEKSSYSLRWRYDLDRALNFSYPQGLTNYTHK